MGDKIGETKMEIKRIFSNKRLSRMEKYNLVRGKSKMLSEEELTILLKEYQRDYDSYDRQKDMKDTISLFLTGIGMLIAFFGIFFSGPEIGAENFILLIRVIGAYVVMSILVLSWIQAYRTDKMYQTQYILDILEKKE